MEEGKPDCTNLHRTLVKADVAHEHRPRGLCIRADTQLLLLLRSQLCRACMCCLLGSCCCCFHHSCFHGLWRCDAVRGLSAGLLGCELGLLQRVLLGDLGRAAVNGVVNLRHAGRGQPGFRKSWRGHGHGVMHADSCISRCIGGNDRVTTTMLGCQQHPASPCHRHCLQTRPTRRCPCG